MLSVDGEDVRGMMHILIDSSSSVLIELLKIGSRLLMLCPCRSRRFSRRCVITMKSFGFLFWW